MNELSLNLDKNYFDNFNVRHSFEKKEMNKVSCNNFSTRKNKQRKNKKVLNALSNVDFMMNRNNHRPIYDKFRSMAIEIDNLHKKLEKKELKRKNCNCKEKNKTYSNFNKEVGSSLLTKKNLAIVGVVAISLLLFTPYRKNLLK
tara:strand:+ start:1465 stop:1896 length:432 start_codon:yes stop_codon:yes gene_type:complete